MAFSSPELNLTVGKQFVIDHHDTNAIDPHNC